MTDKTIEEPTMHLRILHRDVKMFGFNRFVEPTLQQKWVIRTIRKTYDVFAEGPTAPSFKTISTREEWRPVTVIDEAEL